MNVFLPVSRKLFPAALIVFAALCADTSSLFAQQERISPHETISAVIDGNRATIVYGRPHTKDPKTGAVRKIWGGLVPYGKVWRTGADEATLFITQKALLLGGTTVPAGTYTLWTLPQADGSAQLVVSKQVGQWGEEYDPSQDLARIDLARESLNSPVDQFTMAIEKKPGGGGTLKMSWESTGFWVPFSVAK